jgi:Ca-activated chloride channel family protein
MKQTSTSQISTSQASRSHVPTGQPSTRLTFARSAVGTETLTVRQDRRLIRPRWHSKRFVVAQVTAPEATRSGTRPPVNLAFVLDRSGSMDGQKIRLAAQAVEEAVGQLRPTDRFAIVIYDDEVETLVAGTEATPAARAAAIERLRDVGARNMTNLSGGWLAGCEQVATALLAEGVNRCLLLTDGLANVGITDRDALARHAAELRARGVSTSTFGVGDDFDEVLLTSMAAAGGGHFYYIASAAQIRDHIGSEVGETLEVVARGVTLDLRLPEGVRAESLGAFPARSASGRTSIELGDLVTGQQVEVPLRLFFSFGEVGDGMPAVASLSDRDGVLDGAAARLSWEYADDRANDAQPRDRSVDRTVAAVFAARARQRAVELNRRGEYESASEALQATARKIRGYAGGDPELRGIIDGLMRESETFGRVMAEPSRKAMYAGAAYALRSRAVTGMARRTAR